MVRKRKQRTFFSCFSVVFLKHLSAGSSLVYCPFLSEPSKLRLVKFNLLISSGLVLSCLCLITSPRQQPKTSRPLPSIWYRREEHPLPSEFTYAYYIFFFLDLQFPLVIFNHDKNLGQTVRPLPFYSCIYLFFQFQFSMSRSVTLDISGKTSEMAMDEKIPLVQFTILNRFNEIIPLI